MSHLRRTTRPLALCAAVALPLGTMALVLPSAQAASLGKGKLTPSSGNETQYLVMDTAAQCPAAAKTVQMTLDGPGIDASDGNNLLLGTTSLGIVPVNQQGGMSATATATLNDVWKQYGVVAPSGNYEIALRCSDSSGFDNLGTFDSVIAVTSGSGSFTGNYTQASSASPTTTALAAGPADPVAQGSTSTLTATVTDGVPGSVQFKNGATSLGAPVAVSGGQAQWVGALPAGDLSLKATFTPTDTAAHAPSTSSAVPYLVVAEPVLTGAVRVGSSVTCTTSAGGAQSFVWMLDGAATSTTTKTVKVPAAWVGKPVACEETVTSSGRSLTATSDQKTVAKGVFTVVKKPAVTGTMRVGRSVTCAKGTWSPTASTYRTAWLRNGTAIRGATRAGYTLTRADKGKRISCKVTASRTGYTTRSATSAGRLVS